jgi:hypothetical protein
MVAGLERALGVVPIRFRARLAASKPWRWMLGIRMVGEAR